MSHHQGITAFVVSMLVGMGHPLAAQNGPLTQMASVGGAVVRGVVTDDAGRPLEGAMVSALGAAMTALAVTDGVGRYELTDLLPGPYLLRVHLSGFSASGRNFIEVSHAAEIEQAFALSGLPDGIVAEPEVLAAGFLTAGQGDAVPAAPGTPGAMTGGEDNDATGHDHSELAWWLRHVRRSVLREANELVRVESSQQDSSFLPGTLSFFGRAMESSARMASSFFSGAPFTGEINLLTSGSIEQVGDLLSSDFGPRGVAYVELGAPVSDRGAWSVQGAMTRGDVSSWILAGSYIDDVADDHRVDLGMSYSAQRYNGGDPAATAALRADSRTVSSVYAFDRWTVTPGVAVDYGVRMASHDYLPGPSLISPRFGVTVSPVKHTRIRASVLQTTRAPGGEEFLPPSGMSLWLPPERTFAPFTAGADFRAERARHVAVAVERDLGGAYVVALRRFSQSVDDQLVTLFGVEGSSGFTSSPRHYFVANGGNVAADGWGVTFRREIGRFSGSVDYAFTRARWDPSAEAQRIAAVSPSAVRLGVEEFHDVTTSLQTYIPETDTRVFVLYRVNTAFAAADPGIATPGLDGRFDVQVKQRLSFLPFTGTDWELLVAVRNLFREDFGNGTGVYDEMLVVRPPKRIVGGLMVRF